jgi:hypothetical protein
MINSESLKEKALEMNYCVTGSIVHNRCKKLCFDCGLSWDKIFEKSKYLNYELLDSPALAAFKEYCLVPRRGETRPPFFFGLGIMRWPYILLSESLLRWTEELRGLTVGVIDENIFDILGRKIFEMDEYHHWLKEALSLLSEKLKDPWSIRNIDTLFSNLVSDCPRLSNEFNYLKEHKKDEIIILIQYLLAFDLLKTECNEKPLESATTAG